VLRDAITRLNRLTQTFLDFARPSALNRRSLRLDQILQQTAELAAPQAKRQGVNIRCELAESQSEIQADPDQLRQLFLNLVLNSLDAGPTTVCLRLLAPANGSEGLFTVEIEDDGCGLPDGLAGRIFEPFMSSKETGVGLGLTICKRIVETHGGTIKASSVSSGGTKFTVELPRGKE
jgi:signal transduction histidine kinase